MGTLANGSGISGTLTIDTTAGLATAVNVVLGPPSSLTFPLIDGQAQVGLPVIKFKPECRRLCRISTSSCRSQASSATPAETCARLRLLVVVPLLLICFISPAQTV